MQFVFKGFIEQAVLVNDRISDLVLKEFVHFRDGGDEFMARDGERLC